MFSVDEDAGEVEGVEVGVGQGSSSCVDGVDDAGGGGEGENSGGSHRPGHVDGDLSSRHGWGGSGARLGVG